MEEYTKKIQWGQTPAGRHIIVQNKVLYSKYMAVRFISAQYVMFLATNIPKETFSEQIPNSPTALSK